ncbi:MAG: hypothetical protein LC781_13400 [Actinobacteria bacterium]|nr:hypothetical protein [Actinomycetota bacterium]
MNPEQKNLFSRGLLGLLFVGTGVVHRTNAELVPDPLAECRRESGWVTGLSLAAAGGGLFFPRLHRFVRWTMFALLIATFPEGIDQVRNPERIRKPGAPDPGLASPTRTGAGDRLDMVGYAEFARYPPLTPGLC